MTAPLAVLNAQRCAAYAQTRLCATAHLSSKHVSYVLKSAIGVNSNVTSMTWIIANVAQMPAVVVQRLAA